MSDFVNVFLTIVKQELDGPESATRCVQLIFQK